MLLKSILDFYKRLVQDKQFRTKLENISNSEEYQQAIKEAGFNFTREEFESATEEILSKNKIRDLDVSLSNVSDEELEVVFGGFWSSYWSWKPSGRPNPGPTFPGNTVQPVYGVVVELPENNDPTPYPIDPGTPQAAYGVVIDRDFRF